MKNIPLKLFAMLAIFAICSCNKKEVACSSYTVSGTLLDGKTGLPITDSGISLNLTAADNPNNPNIGYSFTSSAPVIPDKNGKFSIPYTVCGNYSVYLDLNSPNHEYYLFDPYLFAPGDSGAFGNIIPQKNINQTWTAATHGWVLIYLQPLSPLPPGDTLLIQIVFYLPSRPDSTLNYSLLTTQSGVLDSFYVPICSYGVGWGRGIKNLQKNNDFEGYVLGDPYVNRYTVKY